MAISLGWRLCTTFVFSIDYFWWRVKETASSFGAQERRSLYAFLARDFLLAAAAVRRPHSLKVAESWVFRSVAHEKDPGHLFAFLSRWLSLAKEGRNACFSCALLLSCWRKKKGFHYGHHRSIGAKAASLSFYYQCCSLPSGDLCVVFVCGLIDLAFVFSHFFGRLNLYFC